MDDTGDQPFVLLPGEGRTIPWIGAQLSVKASAADTDGRFSTAMPAGGPGPAGWAAIAARFGLESVGPLPPSR